MDGIVKKTKAGVDGVKGFEYYKPKSLKEAREILLRYGEGASILNGGTDLIVRIHDGLSHPKAVVDIKGIEGLSEITYDEIKGLTIGACATLSQMGENEMLLERYGVLTEAGHTVGSCQVRNRATMVGNIVNASPLADTATPLLALDAMVKVFTKGGEKEISIHDFFIWVRKTCLQTGDIVTGIRIPNYDSVKGIYQKHARRNEVDLATVCATVIKVDDEVRIALGAVAPTPIRTRKTEAYLRGKALAEEVVEEAVELVLGEIAPIGDIRGSKDYREEIVKVLIRRGLKEIMTTM
jgi:carbon-monoxide dehydrogenase medium subunit